MQRHFPNLSYPDTEHTIYNRINQTQSMDIMLYCCMVAHKQHEVLTNDNVRERMEQQHSFLFHFEGNKTRILLDSTSS